MNLGMRLAAWREHTGWSQARLAKLLGITRSAVWQWEQNETTPRAPMLASAVDAFGITMERFYGPLPKQRGGRS